MLKRYFPLIKMMFKYFIIYFLSIFVIALIFLSIIKSMYGSSQLVTSSKSVINNNFFLLQVLSYALTLLVFIFLLRNSEQNFWVLCKFKKISVNRTINIILLALSTCTVVSCIVNIIQNNFKDYIEVSNNLLSNSQTTLGLIVMTIFAPIFEEIFFRGLILNELKKYLNTILSILIQSVIFALFHGNLLQSIYMFVVSILFSIAYIWTDSIWSNILFHIIFNITGIVILPVVLLYTKQYIYIYITLNVPILVATLINLYKNKYLIINSD